MMQKKIELENEIQELTAQLRDREMALPAHSVRVHQMLVIEELEVEIEKRKKELAALKAAE